MSVFMLSDPHLSFTADKPMSVFGGRWENHIEKLKAGWCDTVGENDTVIIPGDISWGMGLDTSARDLLFIDSLPGKKIIGKGNHDYWWQTMRKLTAFTEEIGASTISFLFNNAYLAEDFIICGSRGWLCADNYSAEDELVVKREAGRLRMSLEEGLKLKEAHPDCETVVFMHYPPAFGGEVCAPVAEVLEQYGVSRCFYGHIHSMNAPFENHVGNTRLYCISADIINFKPMKLNREI